MLTIQISPEPPANLTIMLGKCNHWHSSKLSEKAVRQKLEQAMGKTHQMVRLNGS
jgi:hypothetical protein